MTDPSAPNAAPTPPRIVALWLWGIAILIAIMVTVGGATRLTDSGLSITEWDLVMGSLPPMSDAAWREAFEQYKQIPEYTEVNYGMTLAQFEEIFWWEWGHRFLGRVIGLAFLGPLIVFSVMGLVRGGLRWRLIGLFLLICLQGVIGWFMVASGLSGRIDVSQYRLALHLGTAVVLFCLIVWQALALSSRPTSRPHGPAGFARLMVGAVFVQVILGAFVAGLRAGKTYNTWPLMDGQFVPYGYFGMPPAFHDLFDRIEAVQFNHRLFAYVLFALAAWFMVSTWRSRARPYGVALFAGVFCQMLLGIWTLVAGVPLWLGLVHQAGALAVMFIAVVAAARITPLPARPHLAQSAGYPDPENSAHSTTSLLPAPAAS